MAEQPGTWTKQTVEDYLYIMSQVHDKEIALEMLKLIFTR